MKYFLIGIKGSGMASVAKILLDKGHRVVGSDTDSYVFTEDDLIKRGIKIYNFGEYDFKDIDFVIIGHSFVNNIDHKNALDNNLKVLEYNEFVASLVKEKYSIAVCGSHGKTSTVGLLTHLLKKYNPSYLRGDGEGKWTNSKYFIFEACEYKDHFLKYNPNVTLLLNIDYDHVDYFKTETDYYNSFQKFIDNTLDKVYCNNILKSKIYHKNIYFFNFTNNYLLPVFTNELKCNYSGAIKLCEDIGINKIDIQNGIDTFVGVKRRNRETIINDDVIIDDYAHHPTQINLMISEVKRKYVGKKIIVIFQPDRYSRIKVFKDEFKKVLGHADKVYLMPFLKSIKNDTNEYFDISILGFDVINEISDITIKHNCVYLFLSSKDLSKIESNLKDKLYNLN